MKRFSFSFKSLLYAGIIFSLGTLAIGNALTAPSDERSGWWQLTVIVIGLPVLFDQLSQRDEERTRAGWKPELSVGIVSTPAPIDHFDGQKLPTEAAYVYRDGFTILVHNSGKLAAKYVKVILTNSYQAKRGDDEHVMFLEPNATNPFMPVGDGITHVFRGDGDWVIYPQDTELFKFRAERNLRVGDVPKYAEYPLLCKVYAEGLDAPVVQHLLLIHRLGDETNTKTATS